MKRLLNIIFVIVLFAGCSKEPQPEPKQDWKDSYNGELLLQLAAAHDTFRSKGELPTVIKWEGVNIFKQEYLRAGVALLNQMFQTEEWWKEDVAYPKALVSLVSNDEPFLPKEVAFSDFKAVIEQQYKNMYDKDNAQIATYIKIGNYEQELPTNSLIVMICGSCAAYRDNGAFPDKIDTWDRTYLVSTSNCQIDAAEVIAARDEAWKAANVNENSSQLEKAVAIFNYARDKWTWENYNDTRKGAVGTINAKGGNCCDLSHAVVAMARLSGIPSRYFHAQCHYSSGYIGHVISQLFVDGKWQYADASNDGNKFGTVSFTDYTGLHYYESLPF